MMLWQKSVEQCKVVRFRVMVLDAVRAPLSGTFLQRKDVVNQCLEFGYSIEEVASTRRRDEQMEDEGIEHRTVIYLPAHHTDMIPTVPFRSIRLYYLQISPTTHSALPYPPPPPPPTLSTPLCYLHNLSSSLTDSKNVLLTALKRVTHYLFTSR